MNERIRELAEQANGPNPFFGTLKDQMTLLGDDAVEKFALLIIQSCCEISDEVEHADLPVVASKFVKAHFGVEE